MEALASVPWWGFCIAAFAFVVTIVGVVVWQVIQSRLEKHEEAQFASGKGIAPPTHPEPLHAWTTMACGVCDGGASWMNESAHAGQNMLVGSWGVSSAVLLDHRLSELAAQQRDAWNLVRALRMVLAARAAGYLDPGGCWNRARPIAQELQHRYPSFDAIGHDYLRGLRTWMQVPPDGSADDPEVQRCAANVARLAAASWNGVPYRAAI
ncbi:DUF1266 domain-containing protein [Sandaracinus amylolyticus]|uniref:DUF1266 domain-containing protein n=1 Tax=Sandaracinus amylolyticus TaxID=927083 RepID=A0A0F6W7K6_9BACT|nr:DUF1266 domain-containing protein [Sandaracinus amylolyticus]AKF09302.1 hypothetical protein DB32_006451 [Sandaracinus amylolyticus]